MAIIDKITMVILCQDKYYFTAFLRFLDLYYRDCVYNAWL